MLAQLRSGISALRARLSQLPSASPSVTRYLVPVIVVALCITALLTLYVWRDTASYKPVFGSQERVPVADMMAVLDAEHISYRIHPQTGQVLVPESELGRVRIQLAARGVVALLPSGLELLDKNDPLGVSQFVQDVRFRRGLEGELVQSIITLDPIASARVHLSLPRSTSFVAASEDKGSASVVVTLKPGRHLTDEQIAAIVNLVAGSVSTLDTTRVTLVDQAGNLLSARVDLADGPLSTIENELARRYREETVENIRGLLATVVGPNNYRVSVTAEVDNDRVEETQERFGDDPRVTNEASRDEKTKDHLAVGVPGSLSNRPVNVDASAPASDTAMTKNAMTRQYTYDRNIKQIKRARGTLRRLNVAVVVNQLAAPTRGGWKPEQLANLEKVLRNGLGIDANRGDTLVVSVMPFPAAPSETPWWMERDTVFEAAAWVLYVLAFLLVYWLLVRPLLAMLRQALARGQRAEPSLERETVLGMPPATAAPADAQATEPNVDALPEGASVQTPVKSLMQDHGLPPVGSSVDVLVDHLKNLAAKEPERVAEVVRQWIQRYGRKS